MMNKTQTQLLFPRRHFSALTALAALALYAPKTSARSRARYGAHLRASLPLRLTSIDPHDAEQLGSSLWAPQLFETLFASTKSGLIYPTLANALPSSDGKNTIVELREGLVFSNGRTLTALDVVASIERSKKYSSALQSLPRPRFTKSAPLLLHFASSSPKEVAQLLAQARASIVPHDFSPQKPIGCGALVATSLGSVVKMRRNPLAARGGSYIDSLEVKRTSITQGLRDFEAHQSDVAFLGKGLHQERRDAVSFQLPTVAYVLLLPGKGLDKYASPGRLHSHLTQLPASNMRALGLSGNYQNAAKWGAQAFTLSVSQEEPWLQAIAEEIARAWSRPGAQIKVQALSHQQWLNQQKSRDFDASLCSVSANAPSAVISRDLFALDGRLPPRGGTMPSPEQSCRQLSLGLVGRLQPSGAHIKTLQGLLDDDGFDFANVQQQSS